jgi:hypothetical protein
MAGGLNAATKYIATHRPESLEWGPFEGLGPDIVEDTRRIKSQDGPDLILSGSSTLTSTLLEHGLADEVVLVVSPVPLGTGKRFFAEGTPGTRIRAREHESISVRRHPQSLQGRRAFEDRIVRRRDIEGFQKIWRPIGGGPDVTSAIIPESGVRHRPSRHLAWRPYASFDRRSRSRSGLHASRLRPSTRR